MNTEHTNQSRQAELVNQQLLALAKSFGHKVGCAKNAFGEQCTCGADEAIAAAEQAQAEPVAWKPGKRPPSVFKTSEAGRQYVADFFANALRRHDFYSYIKGHLAADFACALSDGLHAMQTVQQQAEPVAAQCRFEGEEEWSPCTLAHHLLVQAHPKEWPHYETRALYAQPPAVADRDAIRRVFMAHGFTIKDGQTDLKPYVYEAAEALLRELSPAGAVPDGVARAIEAVAAAIYFADSSDYLSTLWDTLRFLSPEIAAIAESDTRAAWERAEQARAMLAAAPQAVATTRNNWWVECPNCGVCTDGISTAAPQGAQPAQLPPYDSFSDDGGESWRDHPADCDFVDGMQLGEEFELLGGWKAKHLTFRVTKVPDDENDDYEVEEVTAPAAAQKGGEA